MFSRLMTRVLLRCGLCSSRSLARSCVNSLCTGSNPLCRPIWNPSRYRGDRRSVRSPTAAETLAWPALRPGCDPDVLVDSAGGWDYFGYCHQSTTLTNALRPSHSINSSDTGISLYTYGPFDPRINTFQTPCCVTISTSHANPLLRRFSKKRSIIFLAVISELNSKTS